MSDTDTRRQEAERRGITIGILVVVLIALGVYFYWHHAEVRGADAPAAAVAP